MRLYRLTDEGEPVRDIQDRLFALGFFTNGRDRPGVFDHYTLNAVTQFQRSKGLAPDGIVGPQTWNALVAAGFRLGDRLLYMNVPMLRGDDVADLQRRLNALGFDSGKADGIFGPDTMRAVHEFQQNRGLAEDGIAGPEIAAELALIERATQKHGREAVRERQWLRNLRPTLAGQRIYLDPFCRTDDEHAATWPAATEAAALIQSMGGNPALSRSVDSRPEQEVRARRANSLGVDVVIGFALPISDGPGVSYFGSEHSNSAAGAMIAGAVARGVGLEAIGRTIPILRETRPPAIVVCDHSLRPHAVVKALADLYADIEARTVDA